MESLKHEKYEQSEADTESTLELKALLIQKTKKNGFEYMDVIGNFRDKLIETYGREILEKTILFNVLGGSGIPQGRPVEQFDVPDGAIEKFIRE